MPSLLKPGVPHAPSDLEMTKIDILNFSRLLLLKAQFHNSTYNDVSVIKPVSNFVPKCTHLESLKGIVEDLELLAGDIVDFEKTNITDNLTPHQREGLNFLKPVCSKNKLGPRFLFILEYHSL